MSVQDEIRTDRLLLRRWRDADRDSFASLNTDSQVMDHFPAALTREESDALADRIEQHFREHGFGLWAVEVPGVVPFAGFVGLAIPSFKAHFAPCVEVGEEAFAEASEREGLSVIVSKVEAVGPASFAMDIGLLENRFEFYGEQFIQTAGNRMSDTAEIREIDRKQVALVEVSQVPGPEGDYTFAVFG